MAFTDTPKIGVALNTTLKAADLVNGGANGKTHRLGSKIWGSDGKRYVYAQANGTIGANTAVASVNQTTFLATATGGTYASPGVAMAVGDQGWFGIPTDPAP